MFLGEYGVEPVCPGQKCVCRRYEEIARRVEEEIDKLARWLQYYAEWRIMCNCILYECPNCNTTFFCMDDSKKLVCPICGDCDMD